MIPGFSNQRTFSTRFPSSFNREVFAKRDFAAQASLVVGKARPIDKARRAQALRKAVEFVNPPTAVTESAEVLRARLVAALEALAIVNPGTHRIGTEIRRNLTGPELFRMLNALREIETLVEKPELGEVVLTDPANFLGSAYARLAEPQERWRRGVYVMLIGRDSEVTPAWVAGIDMKVPPRAYLWNLRQAIEKAARGREGTLLTVDGRFQIHLKVAFEALDQTPDHLDTPQAAQLFFRRLALQFDDKAKLFGDLADVCAAAAWKPSQTVSKRAPTGRLARRAGT